MKNYHPLKNIVRQYHSTYCMGSRSNISEQFNLKNGGRVGEGGHGANWFSKFFPFINIILI